MKIRAEHIFYQIIGNRTQRDMNLVGPYFILFIFNFQLEFQYIRQTVYVICNRTYHNHATG